MYRSRGLVLLGTILSLGSASAASLPRGVGPEFAKYYENIRDGFSCIGHPNVRLGFSQINDNSCDCPDGSDEPGTAACAYLNDRSPPQPLPGSSSGSTNTTNVLPGFWCANAGHLATYVPFLYVNDGVCDYELCCDGTEEYGGVGGVKCENRCNEIGKEYRRMEGERKKAQEKALNKRKTMVTEAKVLRRDVEAKVASLRQQIQKLTAKRDELEKRYEEIKRADESKVVRSEGEGGKLGVLVGLAKDRIAELRESLEKVVENRRELRAKVDELEGILRRFKEEYNPNFNDEGVKRAVKGWEDYAARVAGESNSAVSDAELRDVLSEDSEDTGINWKEFEEEEASDTDIIYNLQAYLPAFARDFVQSKLKLLHFWLVDNGLVAENTKPGTESHAARSAREAKDAAGKDVTKKERELSDQEKDLELDYGVDDIFRVLKDKCVSTDAGEYEYELCWMGSTSQKSKKGHGKTNMGRYKSIDYEMADEEDRADGKSLGRGRRMVLRYEDGQQCWNGPKRSTAVWLACSETEELWKVSELEKCVYKMEVGTPAACDELVEATQPRAKDEL
ncbi:glucosidase 2 subunit beta [Sodiomyces alkalinus F11]|uniref:Glucosidase 2 subunit beta n=1 Tax=Sodiomyces alkalinus (strain CBS 110278 / VKM F-3762 / F11) TaxID=1314773 RepID=A0A3N2Q847_SODAK|nr:glucosidase 2 subunit beta [Sodiomyces alkalinus F11]ROT42857.1 glucosidase 2 subunit beta [Sodiomyces alkalinus F11]